MPRPKRLTGLFARGKPAVDHVHDGYASEPQPLPGSGHANDGPWRRFITSLVYDLELALLWGVLIALSAWFVFSSRPAIETGEVDLGPAGHLSADGLPPGGPFQLVSATARERLVPAMPAETPAETRSGPTELQVEPTPLRVEPTVPSVSATGLVEQHALMADPNFDPLGSLIVSGLPTQSRLSAGTKLLPSGTASPDWAVAFGELDNLVIELPRERAAVLRTRLDLRTRAGLKITSLTLEIRERPAETKAIRNGNRPSASKAKVRPVKASQLPVKGGKPAASRAVKPAVVKSAPVYPGDPLPGPAGAKPLKPPAPLVALPAPTFFAPDPKDTATGGLEPKFRDDPRFTTLKGLGMAPEAIPAPPAEGSVP